MIDINVLRYEYDKVAKKLKNKGFILNTELFLSIENDRKKLQIETEHLRSKYNSLSKLIGELKNSQKPYSEVTDKVIKIKKILISKNIELKSIQKKIKKFLLSIPNIPDDSVPIGKNCSENKNISYWGKIKKYNFQIKDHVELGKQINGFDWFSANEISSSRFVVMKDKMALLYRALGQFMLDVHTTEHGYLEIYVPYLVNYNSMYGAGQLPKFEKELFYVSTMHKNKNNNKYILIPTAEVPLTNFFKNKVINENDLPIMLTAYSPCFRAENLSYGSNTRGLLRMHQFDKVEIFQVHCSEFSMISLEMITFHAERILRLLKLPYRKTLLCTGDTSFASAKTYDLEVWLPSKNNYQEISSCSNMLDFQARRINAKYFQNSIHKKKLLHTINGSGLAIGRTLAAILENYQHADGKIEIPEILCQKYMKGIKFIH
ncbi:serine--tRNA ligase [Buchnera aphidicola]|uniref:serine--tRNA ligase n=1 Tax=Buchnera aphidicola TaxID=9 RepID=UPI003464CD30